MLQNVQNDSSLQQPDFWISAACVNSWTCLGWDVSLRSGRKVQSNGLEQTLLNIVVREMSSKIISSACFQIIFHTTHNG